MSISKTKGVSLIGAPLFTYTAVGLKTRGKWGSD